jgi:hypothetical protein
MKKLLIRYKVKADRVAENENLVKEVYKQLHERNIDGFHYTTIKLEDGVSFIHIAFVDKEEANAAFNQLPAFKNFQANIKDRCEELPVVNQITVIGSYNFIPALV